MPATHDTQLDDPAPLAYRPIAQLTHALEPAAEYMPLAQVKHPELDVAPVDVPKLPAPHSSQDTDADADANEPAAQLTHPLRIDLVPAGQLAQTNDEVAPVVVENVPAGHPVHVESPDEDAK